MGIEADSITDTERLDEVGESDQGQLDDPRFIFAAAVYDNLSANSENPEFNETSLQMDGALVKARVVVDKIRNFRKGIEGIQIDDRFSIILINKVNEIFDVATSSFESLLLLLSIIFPEEKEKLANEVRLLGYSGFSNERKSQVELILSVLERESYSINIDPDIASMFSNSGFNLRNFLAKYFTLASDADVKQFIHDFVKLNLDNDVLQRLFKDVFRRLILELIEKFVDDLQKKLSIIEDRPTGVGIIMTSMFYEYFGVDLYKVFTPNEIYKLGYSLEKSTYERPEYLQRFLQELIIETRGMDTRMVLGLPTAEIQYSYYARAVSFLAEFVSFRLNNFSPLADNSIGFKTLRSKHAGTELLPESLSELGADYNQALEIRKKAILEIIEQMGLSDESYKSDQILNEVVDKVKSRNPLLGEICANTLLRVIHEYSPVNKKSFSKSALAYAILWLMFIETSIDEHYNSDLENNELARMDLHAKLSALPGAGMSMTSPNPSEPLKIAVTYEGKDYLFEIGSVKSGMSTRRKVFSKKREIIDQTDTLRLRCKIPTSSTKEERYRHIQVALALLLHVNGNSVPEITPDNSKDTFMSGKANAKSSGKFKALKTIISHNAPSKGGGVNTCRWEVQFGEEFDESDHNEYAHRHHESAEEALLMIDFNKFVKDMMIEVIVLSENLNKGDSIGTTYEYYSLLFEILLSIFENHESEIDYDNFSDQLIRDFILAIKSVATILTSRKKQVIEVKKLVDTIRVRLGVRVPQNRINAVVSILQEKLANNSSSEVSDMEKIVNSKGSGRGRGRGKRKS